MSPAAVRMNDIISDPDLGRNHMKERFKGIMLHSVGIKTYST